MASLDPEYIVDKSRYWLYNCRTSLDELDVDYIDVVSTIESVKKWDELGQLRRCSFCQKVKNVLNPLRCDFERAEDACNSVLVASASIATIATISKRVYRVPRRHTIMN